MTSEAKSVHSPRLDTVLMVESFIREHSGEYKKRALWENLPKKMMYQTFSTIISYLKDSGKIATDADKKICWIYNPDLIQRYLNSVNLKVRWNLPSDSLMTRSETLFFCSSPTRRKRFLINWIQRSIWLRWIFGLKRRLFPGSGETDMNSKNLKIKIKLPGYPRCFRRSLLFQCLPDHL